ncbi:MAG: ABC transporter ATP-binding protein [Myxococcales bacterium]|nr:ABC transporter ATP-binding protein [Myxococcales bacterium]
MSEETPETARLIARGVSKSFGPIRALNEFDLEIGPGVTGLLGPNGSGKSTLLKLFSGQLRPDTGTVRVLGRDPFRDVSVFAALGLCPEQDKFYEELTGLDFVTALTRLHGYDARAARERAAAAMARVGMTAHERKPIRAMSRGMRQRTKIAQAIAHDPAIVLLDEPLTGADPVARAELIELIARLGAEGRCVVVSSHVLHEVEAMTHQVVLIRFGRLRAQGDIVRLRTLLDDRPYRIRVTTDAPRPLASRLLERLDHVRAVSVVADDALELTTLELDRACFDIPQLAGELGQTVRGFTSPDADLESLYRYLIEEA